MINLVTMRSLVPVENVWQTWVFCKKHYLSVWGNCKSGQLLFDECHQLGSSISIVWSKCKHETTFSLQKKIKIWWCEQKICFAMQHNGYTSSQKLWGIMTLPPPVLWNCDPSITSLHVHILRACPESCCFGCCCQQHGHCCPGTQWRAPRWKSDSLIW